MPDKLLMYSIGSLLMMIPLNSWSWGLVMFLRLVINFWELVKVALKKGGSRRGVDKRLGWVS
jgi:hypothetical protein